MSVQAVIFDMDGTLLDTLEDIAGSANAVLQESGFPIHPPESYRAFIGDGVAELMLRALPPEERSQVDVAEYVSRFRQQYQLNWNVHTGLYPGIADTLDQLQRQGLKLAILSNKPHDFTIRCVEALLSQWQFDIILGYRDDIAPKPNPEGACLIANKLGSDPAEMLFVGDSDNDMRTAGAAGMFPVGVLWGFRSADELRQGGAKVLVSHPREILDLL